MKRFARMWLPALLLAGCSSHPGQSKADYENKVQTAVNATDSWLTKPKDAKLLDQSLKDCQNVIETYAESDFDKSPSMKDLKLMKLSLLLCKAALEQGVAPEVVPEGLAAQSPADSVRQAKEMVENDLHPSASPTGKPTN